MEKKEGLEYKKQLLDIMRKAKITKLSDLIDITSESEVSDSSSSEEEINIKNSAVNKVKKVATCDFQTKIIEMKEYLDKLPELTAKLNTELNMMNRNESQIITASAINSFDQFIWRFNITFEWDDKKIPLPIKNSSDIIPLNTTLGEELTYHQVVSFKTIVS